MACSIIRNHTLRLIRTALRPWGRYRISCRRMPRVIYYVYVVRKMSESHTVTRKIPPALVHIFYSPGLRLGRGEKNSSCLSNHPSGIRYPAITSPKIASPRACAAQEWALLCSSVGVVGRKKVDKAEYSAFLSSQN